MLRKADKRNSSVVREDLMAVTEKSNPESERLDTLTTQQICSLINKQDQLVAHAVGAELSNITKAVDVIANAFKNGGRLVYIGCGTSGRLGVLDASECPVTFGVDQNQVIGLIAGGKSAMFESKEGVEDSRTQPIVDLKEINLINEDVLVGLSASGGAEYVVGGLEYGNQIGCHTISVCCNPSSRLSAIANTSISPLVGPEVLTGSTRMKGSELKAGSAQKMVLNMLSTAAMVKTNRVFKNLMVDFKGNANQKLRDRAFRMVKEVVGGVGEGEEKDDEEINKALIASEWNPKLAILMLMLKNNDTDNGDNCSLVAKQLLQQASGSLRTALQSLMIKSQ